MTRAFSYSGSPAHIVFGNGASSEVATWVEELGCKRALVLSTPHQVADGEVLAKRLGPLVAGIFSGAAMHTPVEVTEAALAKAKEVDADGDHVVRLTTWAHNQRQQNVMPGTAVVALPRRGAENKVAAAR